MSASTRLRLQHRRTPGRFGRERCRRDGALLEFGTDGAGQLVATCPACSRRTAGQCQDCDRACSPRAFRCDRCNANVCRARSRRSYRRRRGLPGVGQPRRPPIRIEGAVPTSKAALRRAVARLRAQDPPVPYSAIATWVGRTRQWAWHLARQALPPTPEGRTA